MLYDNNNIFAKILRGESPCKKLYENEHAFAFWDAYPKCNTHVLVIPKGSYIDFSDFVSHADDISEFYKTVLYVAKDILKLKAFKINTNNGADAHQVVFHFHIHIMSRH